jgi:uncharacterized membrane protein YcjF (UPF0283 family)
MKREDKEIQKIIEEYKQSLRDTAKRYRDKKSNRLKRLARKRVADALLKGKLKRSKCFCGSKKVEAHHKDYTQPLRVRWYCKKHHIIADKRLTKITRSSVTI